MKKRFFIPKNQGELFDNKYLSALSYILFNLKIQLKNAPGLRRSNFRHKSTHSELKSVTSEGNRNSVDLTIF